MEYALVTTTFDNPTEAEKVVQGVLTSRLAACAQRYAVTSDYWWEEKLTSSEEIAVHFKTRAALVEPLKHYILNNHSYKVPQVLVYEIKGGHAAYLRWLSDETSGGRL